MFDKVIIPLRELYGKESSQLVAANFRSPSEGMAEGGCGGNSALPSQKIEASPATLLSGAGHHRKILFSLGEKEIRRAQNEKSKEYFSVVSCNELRGGGCGLFLYSLRHGGIPPNPLLPPRPRLAGRDFWRRQIEKK